MTAPAVTDRRWVVEVAESRATPDAATARLWAGFRATVGARVADRPSWIAGETLALVACADRAAAEETLKYLADVVGLARAAVRVRVLPVMRPVGPPGCCRHENTEYVGLNSRPAARCLSCGLVERAS